MTDAAASTLSLPQMDYRARLDGLFTALDATGVSTFLVTRAANVRYLSGFSGTAGMLLVMAGSTYLFTDGRYGERARAEDSIGSDVVVGTPREQLDALLTRIGPGQTVALEAGHVTMALHEQLSDEMPGVVFTPSHGLVERLRAIKDEGEIARMTAAARLADAALVEMQAVVAPGVTELELAETLEATMRRLGADGRSFATIVASGPNSALPHATPQKRAIRHGELVVFDFGALVDGYHSDMTRTLWAGELGAEQRAIYGCVIESNREGIAAARPGTTHEDVDRRCRDVIEQGGFGEGLKHPSGHNIGLEVHERPYLTGGAEEELRVGQVITVEPGIYLKGIGGVRIEDMVLVTEHGPVVLTQAPKAMSGDVTGGTADPTGTAHAGGSTPDRVDVEALDEHARFVVGDELDLPSR